MRKRFILLIFCILSMNLYGEYISKEKAIELLIPIKDEDYPKSNEVYIVNELSDINEQGVGTALAEEYRKILNTTSRKNNSVSFNYNSDYFSMEVLSIELIKSNGEIVTFDPDSLLTEKISGASQAKNIYTTSDKVLTGSIPNLEIGDIIYTKSRYNREKARLEGQYSGIVQIEAPFKVVNLYEKLTLPKDKPLYIYELNHTDAPYEQKITEVGDKKIYEWNIKDNPVLISEPNMEEYDFCAHHIKYTTIENWEYISRWYYDLVEAHLLVNESIKSKVKELTANAETRQEKAENIFYWVAKNIRYLGVDGEKDRPGLEPHDVIYTFETRGGVCRDKAALLTAMLREAGIGSDVILIKSGGRLNPEVPVAWFNHAITIAYDEGGKPEFFFDPTDENTKDYLPKYEEDNSYLIASKKGETLGTTPTASPSANNSTITIELTLDKDYNAKGTMKLDFAGMTDGIMRNIASSRSMHDMKETIIYFAGLLHPNINMENIVLGDVNDMSKNYSITAKIDIPNFATQRNNYTFVPFSGSNMNMHFMYSYILSPFKLNERYYDFQMPGVFSLDINFKVEFPDEMKNISMPKPKEIDYKGFIAHFDSKVEGNELNTNYHFETSQLHLKKEDYQDIKLKIAELSQNEGMYMIKKGDK